MAEKTKSGFGFAQERDRLGQADASAPHKHRLQGAFHIKRSPLPWTKAAGSALSLGLPILLGVLLGQLNYGLLASMGGFSYLYGVNEPYRKRAKKVLLVLLIIALSLGIGSLSAGSRWGTVLALGVVGGLAFYGSGALQMAPPGGFFFVLACATGTGMPADSAEVPLRMLLILAGGLLAWGISMVGWLIRPHGPETDKVVQAYRQLAAVLEAAGTKRYQAELHQAAIDLRAATEAVYNGGKIAGRRGSDPARLHVFTQKAEALFIAVIQVADERKQGAAKQLAAALRNVAQMIATPNAVFFPTSAIVAPAVPSAAEQALYRQLEDVCESAMTAILHTKPLLYTRPGFWAKLAAGLDRKSLVLPMALRFAVMLMLATSIAYSIGIHRPYWVPLTCAAVMVGTSGMAAVHRALQRFIGTMLGMLLGNMIMGLNPTGIAVAITVMVLQFVVELVIGKNYGFAVLFITPIALLMAEAGHPEYSDAYYITARLTDVFLGCFLGLLGTMLLGQRAASDRLPAVIASTLLCEEELLQRMLENKPALQERHNLQAALINTRAVYDTSLNEIVRSRTNVEAIWPAVASVQNLGYRLLGLSGKELLPISTQEKQQLQHVFFELALAFEHRRTPEPIAFPELASYQEVKRELQTIWERLRVLEQRE